jgi:hypothetical protein
MSSKHRLFVGGFFGASADEVASFWADFGAVTAVTIPQADKNYGFAFVEFRHRHGAKDALSKSAGKRFRGEHFVSAKKASKKRLAAVADETLPHEDDKKKKKKKKKKQKKQKKSRTEPGSNDEQEAESVPPPPIAAVAAPGPLKAKPQQKSTGAVIIESDEEDLF